ncbi:MAG: hypothetical protein B6I31_03035 [Desulfobacteraceae bacterium 4572_19]|nr:MAG: hypothetical protein B6I31_03035 [Desulfobacteraceae bacterium 4572_19]
MLIRYFLILLLFLSFNASSQTYNMNINLSDGSIVSYSVQEIQEITFDGITNIEDAKHIQNIINTFKLFQNYPNPFNPSTTIRYSVPQISNVVIRVFDLLGREVAILVNKVKPAGCYEIKLNGTALPSGVYFYQLRAGSFIDVKKMILLK